MLLTEPMLEVVRLRLRTHLTNIAEPRYSIRITNEEQIPAEAGEEFINLFGAECDNEYPPEHSSRKEKYSMSIGITRRLIGIPLHSTAEAIYTYDEDMMSRTKSSMAKRAYEIIALIDGQWTIPNSIRARSELSAIDFCILTPLGYEGSDKLEEVTAEHFYTEDEVEGQVVGLFLQLHFTGLESYFYKY